jgi:hypothetical protein
VPVTLEFEKAWQGETLVQRTGYRRAAVERRLRRHGYEKDAGEDESVMSGQGSQQAGEPTGSGRHRDQCTERILPRRHSLIGSSAFPKR